MREIELIIEKDSDMLVGMGLVEIPAIESDAYYFNNEKNNYTFAKETEEGLFVGLAMTAEKKIYRFDPFTNEEYYVWFSKETIKQLSQKFMITNQQHNVTEQHENSIKDVFLVYSWIVENEQDPIITKYKFKDVPIGSWVVMYKINNEDIKEKIKSGEIKGFSVEGFFTEKFATALNKEEDVYKEQYEKIKELLDNLK